MSLNKYLKVGFGEEYKQDGHYENPHLVFPLFRIMDRLVITRPGEIPPQLGQELPESDEDRFKRQNGLSHIQFEEDCIYSFSFHTSFVDLSTWTLCDFPGYGSIPIGMFLGNQSPKFVVYEHINTAASTSQDAKPTNQGRQYNSDKKYITSMQLTHFPPDEVSN